MKKNNEDRNSSNYKPINIFQHSMKKLITLLFLTNCFFINSQNYTTSFEEDFFNKDTIASDYFIGLLAIDSTSTNEVAKSYRDKVHQLISSFPPKEKSTRKEKKRIKKIYEKTHTLFLNKYNLQSNFSEIFKTGNYNCVSATALYSYIFDQLKIPYHIKETPTHVFISVYPHTFNIFLETTVPGEHAYLIPSSSKIKKVVDELIKFKLTTENEVLQKGYQKFYEDYFYNKEHIERKKLIGIQYYNEGIFHLQNEENKEAENSFRKANKYYHSPFITLYLKAFALDKLFELEYDTEDDIDYFIKMLSNESFSKEITTNTRNTILYKITEKNTNKIIKANIEKFKKLNNLKVRNHTLEFLYRYFAGRYADDENSKEAIIYCDELLKINNKSKIARQVIEHFAFKRLSLSTFSEKDLEALNENCLKYPFIKENHRYKKALGYLYANISIRNYKNENKTKGEAFRLQFENLVNNSDLIEEINKGLISQLYQIAGNYYYYKDEYRTSYSIYKKGLSYIPNDIELSKKSKWSKEEF